MEEPSRPNLFDVETNLNKFVVEFGGNLVTAMMTEKPTRPNADYVFMDKQIVIELKCFQKNLFQEESDFQRLFAFMQNWVEKGLINQGDELKLLFGTKKIPPECYKDLISAARRTIDRAIHHANKQITETKSTFNFNDAKGIAFLVNDGNYFLSNYQFLSIIADLMAKKYTNSQIDAVVYFTCSQVSRIPGSELDHQLWVPMYKNSDDDGLMNFINDFGSAFLNEYYTRATGHSPQEFLKIDNLEEGASLIGKAKYLSQRLAYKKP